MAQKLLKKWEMGQQTPKVDPQKLIRDWEAFIHREDPNHRLDSPQEAKNYADQIEADLNDPEFSAWEEKYGEENLRAWQGIFKWQADEAHFKLAGQWKDDAREVRRYLQASHLYEEATVDIDGSEPKPNSFMAYNVVGSQTVSPRYFNQPSSPEVEEKIYELCAKVGGAEKAIALIKEFKKHYPEQFNEGGFAEERIPFFDGRKPLQLARALEIIIELGGDPNIFSFLQKTDEILGWKFSFQTANAYLRFHKQWEKEGDAFFAKLKIRAEINVFIKDNGLEEEIDETVIQKITELDAKTLQDFWTIVSESGVAHFFLIYGSKKYDSYWEGQKFKDGSPSERLDAFLQLLKQHGPQFFKRAHELVGFGEKISLDFLPLYLLVHELGEGAEKILPKIKHLLLGQDPNARKTRLSVYWIAYLYAPLTLQDEAREKLTRSLSNVFTFLEKRGLLEKTLDDLQKHFYPRAAFKVEGQTHRITDYATEYILETLALAGTKLKEDGTLEEENLNPENWPYKIFWAKMAVDAEKAPPAKDETPNTPRYEAYYAIAYEMENLFYIGDFSNPTFQPVLTGKMPPPPSPADLERLQRWVDRMTQKGLFHGEEHPHVIGFLLWHGVLGSNRGVPSDEELAHIETLINDSKSWFNVRSQQGYARLVFLCKVRKELWKKAPMITAAFTDAIFYHFHGSLSDSEKSVSLGLLLENEEAKSRLILLEETLNRLNPEAKEQFLALFSKDIKIGGELNLLYLPENLPVYLDACLAILNQSTETILSFMKTLRTSNIRSLSFADPLVFQKLFGFYQSHGEEGLKKVLDDWYAAGLNLSDFNGDERFFHLSEQDIERLQKIKGETEFGSFRMVAQIINMSEDDFQKTYELYQELKPYKISFVNALTYKDTPHIKELVQLFFDEGIFREKMTNGVNKALSVYGLREIQILARNIATTRKVLERLNSFGDYKQFTMYDRFRIFGGVILMNDEAIIGHLARIVEFEARYKHQFFEVSRSPDEIIVYGERRADFDEHPLADEDPFNLLDHSFWRYGITSRTYDDILQGRSKEELVDELLIQFAGLETRVRAKDKSYQGLESVSSGLLSEAPFSKLLKMQWLLNNLNNPQFLRSIHAQIEADFKDTLSEHGGFVRQGNLGAHAIDSLQEPLRFVSIPSEKVEDNREKLKVMEEYLRMAKDEKERREIEEQIAALKVLMDTEYFPPEKSGIVTAGGAFFHYHLHSVGSDSESASYAGPSKPDLTSSLVAGDGLVITRLDENSFNIDYYFSYPILRSNGVTDWETEVVDMGVYSVL